MRLYIIRHGDPDYANDTLTPAGHKEAAALAVRLERLGPDRLYSSPLGRARATAAHAAERLKMPVDIEPWTAELNWKIEQPVLGRSAVWDVHGRTIHAIEPSPTRCDWHTHPPFDAPAFREEFADLGRASDAFLARHGFAREDHHYRVEKRSREKIVVFCHGGFGLTWLAHLLAIPLPLMWGGFTLAPSSVTTVLFDEREPGSAVPRCTGLADVSHLHATDLPVSTSGLKANTE
jgi:broad specificity phosphatase PhoE